jgi:hypothetical protein
MPAWLHSEWRLLHAYVPACSGPARASLSGKRDFKTRDEGTETASLIQFLLFIEGAGNFGKRPFLAHLFCI